MADSAAAIPKEKEAGTPPVTAAVPPAAAAPEKAFDHTTIRGRFNQYTSAFWSLAIPMLSARYIGRWTSNLLRLHEKDSFLPRRLYGFAVGGVMAAVTSIYAKHTLDDMKNVFAETVGWEMNKKPQDVGVRDLWNSKNTIVNTTMKNFVKYNVRRAFWVNLPFFNFLIPGVLTPSENPNSKLPDSKFGMTMANSVDLGVGSTGLYLASDVLTRKETFFEGVQRFIDQKVNHSDRLGDKITAADLINLFEMHQRETSPNQRITPPRMNTPEWHDKQTLFGDVAEKMNDAYGNNANGQAAPVGVQKSKFTIPVLNYLLGNNLIKPEKLDESLGYIEIASNYGVPAVKQVQQAMQGGASFKAATAPFPVTICTHPQEQMQGVTTEDNQMLKSMGIAAEPVTQTSHAHEGLKKSRPEATPASHIERAAQKPEMAGQAL